MSFTSGQGSPGAPAAPPICENPSRQRMTGNEGEKQERDNLKEWQAVTRRKKAKGGGCLNATWIYYMLGTGGL